MRMCARRRRRSLMVLDVGVIAAVAAICSVLATNAKVYDETMRRWATKIQLFIYLFIRCLCVWVLARLWVTVSSGCLVFRFVRRVFSLFLRSYLFWCSSICVRYTIASRVLARLSSFIWVDPFYLTFSSCPISTQHTSLKLRAVFVCAHLFALMQNEKYRCWLILTHIFRVCILRSAHAQAKV